MFFPKGWSRGKAPENGSPRKTNEKQGKAPENGSPRGGNNIENNERDGERPPQRQTLTKDRGAGGYGHRLGEDRPEVCADRGIHQATRPLDRCKPCLWARLLRLPEGVCSTHSPLAGNRPDKLISMFDPHPPLKIV